MLTNIFGMRYHSGVLVPHPGINSSNNVTRIEVFTHLFVRCLMMMMFELLLQTGVVIHTHTCTHTRAFIMMLFGFMFLPIGFVMQEKQ